MTDQHSALPNKLSALIRVSVGDLDKVLADRKYDIDMNGWHYPTGDGKCAVCLAGAVIAKTFDRLPSADVDPDDFGSDDRMRLFALNHVRVGDVAGALDQMGVGWRPLWSTEVPPHDAYAGGPLFRSWLLDLANRLEEKGL